MALAIRELSFRCGFAAAMLTVVMAGGASAQSPLVTGDLTIYYNFDDFTNIVSDGSGNGFNGKVQDATRHILDDGRELTTDGVISNEKSVVKRGGGAIRFAQSEDPINSPVFLDMDGSVIKQNFPAKVPTGAITVAAWLNIPEKGGPGSWNSSGSILQTQSASRSFVTHYQLEGNGTIRLALRGEEQAQNIVNSSGAPYSGHPYPNQPELDANPSAQPQEWPLNEWFHVAYTYDKNANGGAGEFAMYYNGTVIRKGPPNGLTAGEPTGPIDLGAWDLGQEGFFYDGLAVGCVPDGAGGRRLHGVMDELYIFTRALSGSEIATLAMTASASPADFDNDGDVDGNDLATWKTNFGTGATQAQGNADGDADVDGNDFLVWQRQRSGGSVAAVPEPSAILLAGAMALSLSAFARRRQRS
jgi:hypothetical protein